MNKSDLVRERFAVFGAGRSGLAVARLLASHRASVCLLDEKDPQDDSPEIAALRAAGVPIFSAGHCPSGLNDATVLVKSPGIPPTHALVREARRRGLRILSEIEVASAFLPPDVSIVAVTGTNGKTTTTAWIAHLLQEAGFYAPACGNIGRAFSDAVAEFLDAPPLADKPCFVVEVSSFQLEDIEHFRPDVAVLTNLAPDHLDRYATYGDYVAAKANLLRNMRPEDSFVWNADNADSAKFAPDRPPRRCPFSAARRLPPPSASIDDGWLILDLPTRGTFRLVRAEQLPLPGKHNLENALAAVLAASLIGADVDPLRHGLVTFRGVEHRIEFCGEIHGIRFYNDSKATNLDSLEKALESFSVPIVLIAGGRDKKSDYSSLAPLVRRRVKALVTLGEAAPLIEKAWANLVPTVRVASMEQAVHHALQLAAAGDVVLLSPACASYDMYHNFEERGRHFKECVRHLATRA